MIIYSFWDNLRIGTNSWTSTCEMVDFFIYIFLLSSSITIEHFLKCSTYSIWFTNYVIYSCDLAWKLKSISIANSFASTLNWNSMYGLVNPSHRHSHSVDGLRMALHCSGKWWRPDLYRERYHFFNFLKLFNS